jgi:hypothetical protein
VNPFPNDPICQKNRPKKIPALTVIFASGATMKNAPCVGTHVKKILTKKINPTSHYFLNIDRGLLMLSSDQSSHEIISR